MNLLPNDILVFNAIKKLIKECVYSPTLKEIKIETGLSSVSLIKHYVNRLVNGGYIRIEKYKLRSIKIIKELNGEYEVQS